MSLLYDYHELLTLGFVKVTNDYSNDLGNELVWERQHTLKSS